MGNPIYINSKNMNIVILTIVLPFPLDSGGAQAQYNMIDRLRFNHNITLVFPENGMNKMSALEELKRRWPQVDFRPYRYVGQLANPSFLISKARRVFKKTLLPKSERFFVERILKPYGYSTDNRFVNFFNKIVEQKAADVVQIEFYPYLNFVHKLPKGVKKIFVHHEIRYVRNRRLLCDVKLKHREEMYMTKMYKQEIDDLNCYDAVITLTEVDKKELSENGVTTPVYVSPASINSELSEYDEWNGKITFLGGYGHTPNQEGLEWFIDKVVPLVEWKKYPNADIQIIGGGWPETIEKRTDKIGIKRLGFVENLASAAKGSIMIVPILSGSGMRMKILEAAAMGLPILTTSVGVEGLDFENGKSSLISDTAEGFAAALMEIMDSNELRKKITAAARDKFIGKYSVDATARIRDCIYAAVEK